jgi:hypothetical protein
MFSWNMPGSSAAARALIVPYVRNDWVKFWQTLSIALHMRFTYKSIPGSFGDSC